MGKCDGVENSPSMRLSENFGALIIVNFYRIFAEIVVLPEKTSRVSSIPPIVGAY
jgi:hypothetical protein